MTNVQIKNVPSETHAVLKQRAANAHQSLQEYLRSQLIQQASRPTLDEVFDDAELEHGGSATSAEALAALKEERAGR